MVPLMRLQRFRYTLPRNTVSGTRPMTDQAHFFFFLSLIPTYLPSSSHALLAKWASRQTTPYIHSLYMAPHTGERAVPYVSSYLIRPAALLPAPACPVRPPPPPLSLPPYQAGVKHHPCRHRRSCKHTCSRGAAHHLALLASHYIVHPASATHTRVSLPRAICPARCSLSSRSFVCLYGTISFSQAAASLAMSCDRRPLKTVSKCPVLPSSHLRLLRPRSRLPFHTRTDCR